MKKLRYVIVALIICLASACFEINEEITINKDGSGVYNTKMDMGAMLQMIMSMASEEELAKNGLGKSLDTTIQMKDVLDSVKDVSDEQKRLVKDGTIKMQMNMEQSILKADINFPYKSFRDLQELMQGTATGSMGDIFRKALIKDNSPAASAETPGFEQINNIYDITVNDKLISRKVNKVKFDSLMARPEMSQMQSMTGMGMEILYTTTLRLPRPVKKFDNSVIKLSPDKKTVTIKYDMMKLFDNPEQFSYSIEY